MLRPLPLLALTVEPILLAADHLSDGVAEGKRRRLTVAASGVPPLEDITEGCTEESADHGDEAGEYLSHAAMRTRPAQPSLEADRKRRAALISRCITPPRPPPVGTPPDTAGRPTTAPSAPTLPPWPKPAAKITPDPLGGSDLVKARMELKHVDDPADN
ncbi:hypothetical protein Sliba_08290 [Streptomyces nigrescens]|uniref:Uncharacterized protein n=1 Tax=Streptomyces nigrescens TaxID=1920 RepID=A0A640TDN5_STRNI|nr:hypothetical protein Sliba_08290 [Streptomyces libani subsp. libani]GGV86803.1 hypothetical protein GCM10010500_05730 [Streptomyces libani subsp. libani]